MHSRIRSFIIFLATMIAFIWIGQWVLNSQWITKSLGGTSTIELPVGKKLVPYTVQWESKNSHIWYLMEDAEPGYEPKTYTFHESSNMGVMEGTIIFHENK
jgi:hypothetical protein